jgi:hypothetical protein
MKTAIYFIGILILAVLTLCLVAIIAGMGYMTFCENQDREHKIEMRRERNFHKDRSRFSIDEILGHRLDPNDFDIDPNASDGFDLENEPKPRTKRQN